MRKRERAHKVADADHGDQKRGSSAGEAARLALLHKLSVRDDVSTLVDE